MNLLHLDQQFKSFTGFELKSQVFNFPSGCEPHIKVSDVIATNVVRITSRIRSMNDLMVVLLANDALKREGVKSVELFIPYLPFARQDRVMVEGEPLSVRVIADMLNLQGFSKVIVYDVHSEVSLAVIDRSECIANHVFVENVLYGKKDYLIVSPDAGAYKKIFKLCQYLGYKDEIVLCNKTREVATGKIIEVTCAVSDFEGKDLYIVDDICDGGGTFVLLAAELRKRNCGKINLIVSHGIFSKGVELEGIDHVYTTDAFKTLEPNNKLTQIKLCDILI